jgi:transmembrane sensor
MGYYHYEVTDFLEDQYFKSWVFTPSRESCDFWSNFLLSHPEKAEAVAGAKFVLLGIRSEMEEDFPADGQVAAMLDEIHSRKDEGSRWPSRGLWLRLGASLSAAAVVLLTIGWLREPNRHDNHVSYEELLSAVEVPLMEQTNTTTAPILLTLPDSSTILLQPKSSVSYRKDFVHNALREVYLSGEAFFTVSKNRRRPFVVYSNELVTKVLGTSFIVKAFEDARQVEVSVKTGKVSVFRAPIRKYAKGSPPRNCRGRSLRRTKKFFSRGSRRRSARGWSNHRKSLPRRCYQHRC